jgi:hypothetical protein
LALPDNRLFALHDCFDLAVDQVKPEDMNHAPKYRSALDARPALCLHIEIEWPGAGESER